MKKNIELQYLQEETNLIFLVYGILIVLNSYCAHILSEF